MHSLDTEVAKNKYLLKETKRVVLEKFSLKYVNVSAASSFEFSNTFTFAETECQKDSSCKYFNMNSPPSVKPVSSWNPTTNPESPSL